MMTTKLPTYDKYKPSGVEWLGEIPEHWEVTRVKNLIVMITGYPFKSEKYSESGIKLARGINVKEGVLNWDETRYWPQIEKHIENYLLKSGDVLIAMDGSKVGKNFCMVTSEDLPILLLQRVARLRAKQQLLPKILFYNILCRNFLTWVEMTKTDPMVPHISPADINNYVVSIPPLEEQTAIAQFLDHKTALIDQAIDIKQKQIELLKERRQILIHQAVTRGLNPEVKMKDSGVEWIGDTPEHWKITRLKNLVDMITGYPFKSEKYSESGIKLARGINVKEGVLNWDETRCWPQIEKHIVNYLLSDGDVLIAMDGSKVGKNFCIVTSEDLPILLLQRVARLRAKRQLLPKFLFYNILCRNFLTWVEMTKTDPMVPHISPADINNFIVSTPPLEEQTAVAEFLDRKTALIDTAITLKQQEIAKLQEYKATLINSAVTGKIKVGSHAQ